MNKRIYSLAAGGSLLFSILSGDIAVGLSPPRQLIDKKINEQIIGNVDYPHPRDIRDVVSYFDSFCKAYDTTEGSEEEKIKRGIDYTASLDDASEFSKEVKRAYDFNEDTRKGVKSYFDYFLKRHKKPEGDLEGWIEGFYESYNEIGEESRNIQRKYLNAVPLEKQKDMADLKLLCEYINVQLDPLIRLERAIERANRRLQKSIVDDLLELEERIIREKAIPALNPSDVAKYLLIKNFKEVGEETYRQWLSDIYNEEKALQKLIKDADEFITTYDKFYDKMHKYLGDDPIKKLLPEE